MRRALGVCVRVCVCVLIPLHWLVDVSSLNFMCNRSVRLCVGVTGFAGAHSLSGYTDREVNSRSIEGQISQH